MRLFYASTSPYARKVRVVIAEKGLEAQQSLSWNERWRSAIDRALVILDGEIDSLAQQPNLAHIAYACALGYLDFRLPDIDWRARHPKTAAWFDTFTRRPSMTAT